MIFTPPGASRVTRRLLVLAAGAAMLAEVPAQAQSILRDAETEALFHDMSAPIVVAAGLRPNDVSFVLINDDSINAFVVGGQTVYIHSGLIEAAVDVNQVQGVIAHELGHVADAHIANADAGTKPAMAMYLLSMLAGIAAAAVGGGEAGMGIMAAGQQAAMGKYLSFSRTQEATADASAIKYLHTAGITAKGMLSFFKTLQQQEYRYGLGNLDPFMQSHPLSGTRIATLEGDVKASPSYNKPIDPALQERFLRVKAKLKGYVQPYQITLNEYPERDRSIYARYARAYAYHKGGFPEKADAEASSLVKAKPDDPYFEEVMGQILLEAGKPKEALAPLKAAVDHSRSNPLISTTYGHALIATEDRANFPEAIRVLRTATQRDDANPFAWYQLGTAYEASGDEARAALAGAEQASLSGDDRTAAMRARNAMAGLPKNTSDWIRAQDIAMTAGDAVAKQKKKR